MDTMKFTMASASVLGAVLFFMLSGWAAESIYRVGGHYGDEDHTVGYYIEVEGETREVAEAVPEVPFAELYASADATAGEGLWRQCQACHVLEAGANGTGPYLHGVVGRPKASANGFNYSDALASLDGDWTPENIATFIDNPRSYAQGTSMSYSFRGDAEDAADLIAYIATFN